MKWWAGIKASNSATISSFGQDGQFYTFRAAGSGSATCTPFWTANFRNNFGPGYSITLLDGSVYLTTPGGTLYALHPA